MIYFFDDLKIRKVIVFMINSMIYEIVLVYFIELKENVWLYI